MKFLTEEQKDKKKAADGKTVSGFLFLYLSFLEKKYIQCNDLALIRMYICGI